MKVIVNRVEYKFDLDRFKKLIEGEHCIYKTYLSSYIRNCTSDAEDGRSFARCDYDTTGNLCAVVVPKLVRLGIIKRRKGGMFEVLINLPPNNQ